MVYNKLDLGVGCGGNKEMYRGRVYFMNKLNLSVRDLCGIGIFSALIVIMSQISIPMPYGVPMTMQTFAVPLAGMLLGVKKGTISTVVYLLLGAVGLPVFAGFTGGIGILFGMTGGFLLSFPLMALAAGAGEAAKRRIWLVAGLVAGAAINFVCGMLWFSVVMSSSLATAFAACVLPFIPTGVVKIVLVAVLGAQIKKVMVKSRVLL